MIVLIVLGYQQQDQYPNQESGNLMKRVVFCVSIAFIAALGLLLVSCGDDDDDSASNADTDGECAWGWGDSTRGLCWQDPPSNSQMFVSNALKYCQDMSLDDHSDWRLPNINELRSLIRGCPANGLGGACGVSDPGCLNKGSCRSACESCTERQGPGKESCYWSAELGGACDTKFWSSSEVESDSEKKWFVNFANGEVGFNPGESGFAVRCVRSL